MTQPSLAAHGGRPALACLLLCLLAATASFAAEAPKARVADPRSRIAAIGLPEYTPPDAYSVDLVIRSPKQNMVLKRFIDQGRMRTEITSAGEDLVMIEMGDAKGTTLMLSPKEKRAMKQSRAMAESMAGAKAGETGAETKAGDAPRPPPDMKIEDLGEETLDGRSLKKIRMTVPDGTSLGWFDKTTGAPVRMEAQVQGETTILEWKNYKVAAQPAKLFEAPKGYEVTDMDEMMEQMKGMGGMGAMGGVGGAMKGMMGGMGQGMGQSLGGSLGASLGGAMGGPLGAMAGHYLGGKIGGMVGKKAVDVVTPGK